MEAMNAWKVEVLHKYNDFGTIYHVVASSYEELDEALKIAFKKIDNNSPFFEKECKRCKLGKKHRFHRGLKIRGWDAYIVDGKVFTPDDVKVIPKK